MEISESQLIDFEVLSKVGEGVYGQVFKVRRKADGHIYAIKKVKMNVLKQKQRDNALNQIRILASYNGQTDHIIDFKESFFDQKTNCLCIVMEFASGGDIYHQIQKHQKNKTKFSQEEIWKAILHISRGLQQLHSKKILHRDIKAANVFISEEGNYKLGDLNVSKVLKKDLADTQTGTPYYASPEVWKDQPYGTKSDIWSLGCLIYEMASLKPPFTANDLKGLYRKVLSGKFDRIPSHYSTTLNDFISKMISIKPEKRPTAEEIIDSTTQINNIKSDKTIENSSQVSNKLLKTIKCNLKNMKNLKNHLPKSNYQKPIEQSNCLTEPPEILIPSVEIQPKPQKILQLDQNIKPEQILKQRVMSEHVSNNQKVKNISDISQNSYQPKIAYIRNQYHYKKNYHDEQRTKKINSEVRPTNKSEIFSSLQGNKQIDYKIPKPQIEKKEVSKPTPLVDNFLAKKIEQTYDVQSSIKKLKEKLNKPEPKRKVDIVPKPKPKACNHMAYPSWWG